MAVTSLTLDVFKAVYERSKSTVEILYTYEARVIAANQRRAGTVIPIVHQTSTNASLFVGNLFNFDEASSDRCSWAFSLSPVIYALIGVEVVHRRYNRCRGKTKTNAEWTR